LEEKIVNVQTRSTPVRRAAPPALSLLTLCLLFLALGRPQQVAYSKGMPSSPTEGPALLAETPSPTPMSCPVDPPTGKKATIVSDDEVLLSYRFADSSRFLRNQVIDNAVGSKDLVADPARSKLFSLSNLDEVHQLADAAADLNGDGRAEIVSAFQNHSSQIGAIANPFSTAADHDWSWSGSPYADTIDVTDVAAGDVDRNHDNDEVVVAFKDDQNDPRVVLLDGSPLRTDGTFTNSNNGASSVWSDNSSERDNVNHVSVAIGDLNGDGSKDEIVLAFKDGGQDLQVVMLKFQSATSSLKEIWQMDSRDFGRDNTAKDCSMWDNTPHPLDVTTGDVDGDMKDEAILAFRIGSCDDGQVQLLVLDGTTWDATNQALTIDSRVWRNYVGVNYYGQAYNRVSVAAGDLNDDGVDEIVVGANTLWVGNDHDSRHWQTMLATFEYVPFAAEDYTQKCSGELPGCLHARETTPWTSGSTSMSLTADENKREAAVVVATGDLEQDGKDEIALVRYNTSTGDPEVWSFDADAGLVVRDTLPIDTGSNSVWEFWLDMGDQDGDSLVANYTGECYSKSEAHVLSVIHAPPHGPGTGCDWTTTAPPYSCSWEANYLDAQAAFGAEASQTVGWSTGSTVMIGGEVSQEAKIKEVGPSFTYAWEKSFSAESTTITNTSHGSELETKAPITFKSEASTDELQFVNTDYNCYKYHENTYGDMDVCVPLTSGDAAYPLEKWYSDEEDGALAAYPDSWVPVGMNLAQGATAGQSSNFASSSTASKAVDGNTNGVNAAGSVSYTGPDPYPWWQVDLGGVQQIDGVQIWNRTDCCGTRLSNFYVFVSEEPFPDKPPADLAADLSIWHTYHAGAAGTTTTLPVGEHGRYLRVQLDHQDYLQLAEVQVWGVPGEPKLWPIARPTSSSDEKFTVTWPGNRTQEIPGQLLYTWPGSTYKYVKKGADGTTFEIGVGKEGETIREGSTSNELKLGMSLKYRDGEVSVGTEQQKSYILGWSNEVNFNGKVGGLPSSAPYASYYYAPFVWLQRTTSGGGVDQAYFVLDYWWTESATPSPLGEDGPAVLGPQNTSVIAPAIPLISSPTHPDPATWVMTNTATFTWAQPSGDPATVAGYTWLLDRTPDTVPAAFSLGLRTTETFRVLADGVSYMHVRARGDGEQWSETANRAIRVDANPPKVQLSLQPGRPDGDNGWYVTPVTVTVSATDGTGSGVTTIEFSTDGVTWQPYAAPLAFSADTPGTTVYARAGDVAGHVSEPVLVTFKIDRTRPDSHVAGGDGPGALVARLITNPTGNEELVLAGAVADAGSGASGMSLEYDGLDWTGTAAIGAGWVFTATEEIGAGNHTFMGRSQDAAGNVEEPYEIARVLWYPQSSPDIAGSSLAASPSLIRPGDVVTFTIVARNAGRQEAHVAVVDTLPAGLVPVEDSLGSGVSYDAVARTLTWQATLLWPGQWVRHTFQAQAAAALPATRLANAATLHAFWPNTGLLPPAQRRQFLDHEQTVTVTATVRVVPNLPAGADRTPPWVFLERRYADGIVGAQVQLSIPAAPDARRMFLREWTLDSLTGAWIVAQDRGWLDYAPTITWKLSTGQGVKYLGVWVADAAGNVSTLDEHALVFVNRVDGSQVLAAGGRVQYRGLLQLGTWAAAVLTTVSGDPDMYVWKPRNAFWPDTYRNDRVLPGQMEDLVHRFLAESGRYLLEVQAVGASEYRLDLIDAGHLPAGAAGALAVKPRPEHPLVISDPLSAGQVGPVVTLQQALYLPLISRGN
jgi:uncharacterized repeat protein (TIGR01451 family)